VKEIELLQGNGIKIAVPNGSERGLNDRSERLNEITLTEKPTSDTKKIKTLTGDELLRKIFSILN
jgi:hypothetical protein